VVSISDHPFSLSGTINQRAATKTFRKTNRVLVPDVLEENCTALLMQQFSAMPDWNLVFRNQRKHYDLSTSGFEDLDPREQADIKQSIYSCAQKDFGYMYKNYPIFDLVQSGNCIELLEQFLNFLNSSAVLEIIRRISGIKNISYADAQLTRYDPGHFLSSHDDLVEGKNRLAAYVFNLTSQWHPDWGGNLMFYDDKQRVTDVYVPKFNSLALFAVGTQHAVSLVSPFARCPRFAITGWFRF